LTTTETRMICQLQEHLQSTLTFHQVVTTEVRRAFGDEFNWT
jgi:hypothetical protein